MQVVHASDALVELLLRERPGTGYAELATPTDAFAVPLEVVEDSRRRWAGRGWKAPAQVPARLVAVYAPGLAPMDFHAVVEADVGGVWKTVDSTRLAPTSSLVRICAGRDAADTAFLSLFGGLARFETMTVTATTAGTLPAPDDVPFPLP